MVAAWMLDPATCAGMSLGAPRVTSAALAELHQLLTERGFRRSSRDDPTIGTGNGVPVSAQGANCDQWPNVFSRSGLHVVGN